MFLFLECGSGHMIQAHRMIYKEKKKVYVKTAQNPQKVYRSLSGQG